MTLRKNLRSCDYTIHSLQRWQLFYSIMWTGRHSARVKPDCGLF